MLLTTGMTAVPARATSHDGALSVFVGINVQSPVLKGPGRVFGSGVLLSSRGFILTAAHVVTPALDEGTDENKVEALPGARISVQITGPADQLDEREFEARVVWISNDSDVAIVQADFPDDVLIGRVYPTLDSASSQITCAQCLRVFGRSEKMVEYPPGSPSQALQGNFRRLLTSAMKPGYSGGPVFYTGPSRWTLVGIGVSGDSMHQATNYMVTLHAAVRGVASFKDELDQISRDEPFPSQAFLDLAHIDIVKAGDAQVTSFVRRELAKDARGFIDRILAEDFGGSDRRAQEVGTLMLERVLEALRALDTKTDPGLYTAVVDKLVTVYEVTGRNRRLSVARWREDVLVQSKACDRVAEGGTGGADLVRCWKRLLLKYQQIWSGGVRDGYHLALSALRRKVDDRASTVAQAEGWGKVQLEQMIEWGDFFSRLGGLKDGAIVETLVEEAGWPSFIGSRPVPADLRVRRGVLRAAAADKFYEGVKSVRELGGDKDVKAALTTLDDYRRKLCDRIRREITDLLYVLDQQRDYYLAWQQRQTNEVPAYCR